MDNYFPLLLDSLIIIPIQKSWKEILFCSENVSVQCEATNFIGKPLIISLIKVIFIFK